MKKVIAVILVLMLALALPVPAFAAEDNRPVKVTTSITPTYTVTIPLDVAVEFDAASTNFGEIELSAAQLDPGYAVKVALSTSGSLVNAADANKTIPYTVNVKDGPAFTYAAYTTAGDKTELTINISQASWDAAYAGSYSDTVTFTISYVEITAIQ